MTTTDNNATFWERNDETLFLNLTRKTVSAQGVTTTEPLDLTGAILEVYIKPDVQTEDDAISVVLLSTEGPEPDVLITEATAGRAEATVHSEHNLVPGTRVWRVDVVDANGNRKTSGTGTITTINT